MDLLFTEFFFFFGNFNKTSKLEQISVKLSSSSFHSENWKANARVKGVIDLNEKQSRD